jgi:hypothetical protein
LELAALVAGLPFVAVQAITMLSTAATLIARVTLVAELTGRLAGKRGHGKSQSEQCGSDQR